MHKTTDKTNGKVSNESPRLIMSHLIITGAQVDYLIHTGVRPHLRGRCRQRK